MLNRESAPVKGLWNGVGGKIKMNETAKECARREVKEETALKVHLDELVYKGLITWEADGSDKGGMYVYLINLPKDFSFPTPKKVREGILDWKKISWLVDDQNLGTGEMPPPIICPTC
ncbi:NUDIX domain-containing protein [Halobacillus rhizosphaerae]|uniref:NUDIX hydrolase n=1 Tax=Halobacillus rhizosphaerae TaxID=3064889 RepID=UPI00398ADB30